MLTEDSYLPHHFDDVSIIAALKSSFLRDSNLWPFNQNEEKNHPITQKSSKVFPMICGLLLRLRTAMFRVVKRSRMRELSIGDTYDDRLYRLMKYFVSSDCDDELLNDWTPATLFLASTELSRKAVYLSPRLQKELSGQPLIPLNPGSHLTIEHHQFLASFLSRTEDEINHSLLMIQQIKDIMQLVL